MTKKAYIPRAQDKLKTWLSNYKTKIATHGADLGLTEGEITDQQALCTALIAAIDNAKTKADEAKAANSTKKTQRKTSIDGITNAVTAFKTRTAYTETIGNELGVIGEEDGFEEDTYKPELKATVFSGNVRIDFKKDITDGVNIYARLLGQTTWTFLALDTHSPYTDTRPLTVADTPETREYMVRAVINDEQIGLRVI